MSREEEKFEHFCCDNQITYRIPTMQNDILTNIPFNKNGKYRADFYLPKKGDNGLFIEVKGQMTFFTICKLKYLLDKCPNFYILQMTSEIWIPNVRDDNVNYPTINSKIEESIKRQFKEILTLPTNKLHDLSSERLKEYERYLNQELSTWLKCPSKVGVII